MAEEKLQIDYDYLIQYLEDAQNVIGANTSTTLRTITTYNDTNCKHVRKFGIDYAIGDITNAVINTPRSDGGGTNKWRFELYDETEGDIMGTIKDELGASTFVDGTAVATGKLIMILVCVQGTATPQDGDTITLTTDTDPGGLTVYLSGENHPSTAEDMYFAVSATGSTYYMETNIDFSMRYGGHRHTPDGTAKLPYFDPVAAEAALGGAFTIVTVLDSATYEVPDWVLDSITGEKIQAALGQTPTLTGGVGSKVSREVEHDGNNSDTKYVSKSGDDANSGTFQEPYLTIQFAENSMGGLTYINVMDSGIYTENLLINVNISIEPLYGFTPTIRAASSINRFIELTTTGTNIYGFIIDGLSIATNNLYIPSGFTGDIKDNNIINAVTNMIYLVSLGAAGNIEKNYISNGLYGVRFNSSAATAGIVTKNYINNCNIAISKASVPTGAVNTNINNNVLYDNIDGINIENATSTATIENNTITKNSRYGLSMNAQSGFTGTIRDNIIYDNTTFDLIRPGGVAITITESNYETNSGFTIGAGCITTDPEFCKTIPSYKFGISAKSGAYRTDTSSDDMGAHFRLIEINESNIEINGFKIDGQEQYNNAIYILDTVNHIGTLLKWNSIYDFQGIEFDPYDNDTNTDCLISNCKFYNGGNGIKFSYGGNTVQESLIYNNAIFGIHSDQAGQIFDHNVFFGNQYNIYFESNTGSIIFKNNISHKGSSYGIYSEVSISVTYCCITDRTYNVNTSATSNTSDDPLFVSEITGSEDFNIKTRFGGWNVDSPCFLTADDSKDIGAYDVDRSIGEEGWKKYVFETNPTNGIPEDQPIGQVKFSDALGSRSLWAKSDKLVFPLEWEADTYSTEEQLDKIRYISRLIPKRSTGKTQIKDCTNSTSFQWDRWSD